LIRPKIPFVIKYLSFESDNIGWIIIIKRRNEVQPNLQMEIGAPKILSRQKVCKEEEKTIKKDHLINLPEGNRDIRGTTKLYYLL